ncbi:phosphatase PAP2 family protein [Thermopolyspora sp. NPDC052614]|uniref:phosphatase PAP2 family protein n=1 Tax=Thermopolyspora sp. NPDC052614 TaxID=3155682 RepID=UPI0034431C0D
MPLALVVMPLAAAALLGLLAKTPEWTRADLRIAREVHELRNPGLTALSEVLRVVFLPPGAIGLCVLTVAALVLIGRFGSALLTVPVVAAAWSTNSLFKAVIDRPRPDPELQLDPLTGYDSFPSGHVAVTLALVIVWCLSAAGSDRLRFRLAVLGGATLVVAQSFARVYLGAHYPTDAVGALLVVSAVAMGVIAVVGPAAARLDRTQTTVREWLGRESPSSRRS